ncbi:hypothetical protein NQZ79_g2906 [Umbelopsis isabellina]|nr:hypothetical protein NQZ79_g2906 [Umbelopsis isabellina]
MVDSLEHPLKGVKKNVRIIFIIEALGEARAYGVQRHNYGKKHSTWGEEKFIHSGDIEGYLSTNGKLSLCVKFEVLQSKADLSLTGATSNQLLSEKFYNNTTLSDISFRVVMDHNEQVFPAHKIIMAGASPFFETMFTNGMQETYSSEILLNDTDPTIFSRVLYYCYSMKLYSSSLSEVEKIIIMADRFGIDGLKEEGFRQLRKELSAKSVWDTWALADKYNCKTTYRYCQSYIAEDFVHIIKHPNFLSANPNVIVAALQIDVGNFPKEEEIFEALIRWANYESVKYTLVDKISTYVNNFEADFENLTLDSMGADLPRPDASSNSTPTPQSHSESEKEKLDLIKIKKDDTSIIRRHSIGVPERRRNNRHSDELSSPGAESSPSIREILLPSMLQHIRFPVMTIDYLSTNVAKNEFVMSMEGMKDLVGFNQSFAYKRI